MTLFIYLSFIFVNLCNCNKNISSIACELQSVAKNEFHIVIAGYKRISSPLDHYITQMGFTNARITFYRREDPHIPPFHIDGPCGETIAERILLPNTGKINIFWHKILRIIILELLYYCNIGKDASAFYDYALQHYDNPPRTIVYLHGHAMLSWHSSCSITFSRMLYYYRNLTSNSTFGHMIRCVLALHNALIISYVSNSRYISYTYICIV